MKTYIVEVYVAYEGWHSTYTRWSYDLAKCKRYAYLMWRFRGETTRVVEVVAEWWHA